MEQKPNTSSRRKFVFWGLGIASSLTALRLILPKKKKNTTVKMLSEDGKLVEVNVNQIQKTGLKVSDKDIHAWIKK